MPLTETVALMGVGTIIGAEIGVLVARENPDTKMTRASREATGWRSEAIDHRYDLSRIPKVEQGFDRRLPDLRPRVLVR